jgi:hypothetical protein
LVRERLYNLLGELAVLTAIIAMITSFTAYLVKSSSEYLFYGFTWLFIGLIDYIIWKSKPGKGEMVKEREGCGLLREAAELVAILYYLSEHREEYAVAWRINSLLNKLDSLRDNTGLMCGEDTLDTFNSFIEDPSNDELASKTIRLLHECMLSNGCRSNVSLEE